MGNNVPVTPGVGAIIATDDIGGGVEVQWVKLDAGAAGFSDQISSGQKAMAHSLPVTLASDQSAISVASHAVTNAGTFAVQASIAAAAVVSGAFASGSITDGAMVTLGAKADARSTATDGTAVTVMQVLKEISFMAQTPAALPANQSTNVAQIAGTAASVSSGLKDAGTLRVVLATDQPALTNKLLVTPDANSAVNAAQINGVTPLMGNGLTGTGSLRVTIASDNTAFAVNATLSAETTKVIGTTRVTGNIGGVFDQVIGSAVPANALYVGISDGANIRGILGAANALNSTGTGIPTAQIVAQFDDVSPTAITENQFGNLRMSANRNIYNTIRDAAGNERGANVNASSQLSVSVDNNPVLGAAASTIVGQVKITDGTNVVDVLSVTKKAIVAAIVDASGNQITSFGGAGTATTVSTDVTRPADTNVYAANDAWADSTTVPTSGGFTFTSPVNATGKSGVITDAIIVSSNDPATLLQGELWIYDQAVTAVNDNAAFASGDADTKNLVAVIPFTMLSTVAGSGTTSYAHVQNLSIGFTCVGTANLRFLVKVKNAYTPASAEVLTCRLKIIQSN